MPYDYANETAQDTPVKAWQHAWKNAARADARLKARHLAIVDAYAEHYYDGRAAMRGIALSVERVTYWTRLSERTVKGARADLVRWGWLGLVKAHGRGLVARYALTTPEGVGITAEVIPKECKSCTVNAVEHGSEECKSCTLKAVKSANAAHIPLPSPLHLPTPVPDPSTTGQTSTRPGPPRGRQGTPSTQTPKTAAAARSELERAIPPGVLSSARGARSGPVLRSALGRALAAGWTPEQVRAELDGAEAGSRQPVAVCVHRMNELAKTTPPAAPVPSISPEAIAAALHAGQECPHGDADLTNPATGLHVCPICRRAAATA